MRATTTKRFRGSGATSGGSVTVSQERLVASGPLRTNHRISRAMRRLPRPWDITSLVGH